MFIQNRMFTIRLNRRTFNEFLNENLVIITMVVVLSLHYYVL